MRNSHKGETERKGFTLSLSVKSDTDADVCVKLQFPAEKSKGRSVQGSHVGQEMTRSDTCERGKGAWFGWGGLLLSGF